MSTVYPSDEHASHWCEFMSYVLEMGVGFECRPSFHAHSSFFFFFSSFASVTNDVLVMLHYNHMWGSKKQGHGQLHVSWGELYGLHQLCSASVGW